MFFFFNDTATTEIYTLSLHDALPIFEQPGEVGRVDLDLGEAAAFGQPIRPPAAKSRGVAEAVDVDLVEAHLDEDRKSTRLNSSHANISYAVFCLKKKMPALRLISAVH